jgi:8-oxo-dGTP diphosphatase
MAGVVVAAAIVRGGKLLVAQRPHPEELAGLWELPGGQVEDGELEAEALRRECVEELRGGIVVGDRVGPDLPIPGRRVLRAYAATLAAPTLEPVAVVHKDLRWVRADELESVDWLPADLVLLPALRQLLADAAGPTAP